MLFVTKKNWSKQIVKTIKIQLHDMFYKNKTVIDIMHTEKLFSYFKCLLNYLLNNTKT